jgi:alpha/beta superfamily hydrolase
MDSDLINKLVVKSQSIGNSSVAFDFPYITRGEENYSGPELLEEIESLEAILQYCVVEQYRNISLIGKSLGGIVASKHLAKLSPEESKKYRVTILGYVVGFTDVKNFPGKITIVQGSKDKYGDITAVKQDMASAVSKYITYITISGADHSYRVPETKDGKYEDEAVGMAFQD